MHFCFLHNIKKRKFLNKLLKWIKDFLKNRSTTLIIKEYTMTKCKVSVNILQKLSFFSVLYLFYNANLLNLCKNVRLRFSVIKFVNDINILTYNKSTKRNCEILKKTWNKIIKWTNKYKFKFNEQKHKLICFSRISKRYNINVDITLKKYWVNASIDFKILKCN